VLRVTADSNIYISALNFPGNPERILQMAKDGEIRLAISDAILDEVAQVLRRPKFGWGQDRVARALHQISAFTEHVEPKQRIDVITEDPTDNRILECAVASGSQYLVTGDKHLLKLGLFKGARIVMPAEFLEISAVHGRLR
jgi:putative PIN family toxin of toxin-antitoxin system